MTCSELPDLWLNSEPVAAVTSVSSWLCDRLELPVDLCSEYPDLRATRDAHAAHSDGPGLEPGPVLLLRSRMDAPAAVWTRALVAGTETRHNLLARTAGATLRLHPQGNHYSPPSLSLAWGFETGLIARALVKTAVAIHRTCPEQISVTSGPSVQAAITENDFLAWQPRTNVTELSIWAPSTIAREKVNELRRHGCHIRIVQLPDLSAHCNGYQRLPYWEQVRLAWRIYGPARLSVLLRLIAPRGCDFLSAVVGSAEPNFSLPGRSIRAGGD